jgi:hypothetical protein
MYQTIGEKVLVAGVYTPGKFIPKKFQWRHRTFPINQIYSVHDFKDGSVRKRRFSVMAKHNVYLLEFNRDIETWILAQLWIEA